MPFVVVDQRKPIYDMEHIAFARVNISYTFVYFIYCVCLQTVKYSYIHKWCLINKHSFKALAGRKVPHTMKLQACWDGNAEDLPPPQLGS